MVMPANATIKHCYSALILHDLGYLRYYRAFVHLCTMASGSCAEPGGRPSSLVYSAGQPHSTMTKIQARKLLCEI